MLSNTTFVVTNPLHYVYFLQKHPNIGRIIASSHGMLADAVTVFNFQQEIVFYDVANSVNALIEADAYHLT